MQIGPLLAHSIVVREEPKQSNCSVKSEMCMVTVGVRLNETNKPTMQTLLVKYKAVRRRVEEER